jgi:tetratricopeptide (TPR) repeat protein
MTARLLPTAILLLFVAAPLGSAAWAAQGPAPATPSARELTERGLAHYNVGEYDQAIEAFKQAYLMSNEPGLLFNIAQSYRLKGDCNQALQAYKSYLRADPAANRAKIEARIAEMEKCVQEKGAARPTVPPEAPPPSPPSPTEPGPGTPAAPGAAGAPAGAAAAEPSRWPPLALGAGGLVVAGVGAALLISVGGDFDDLKHSCAPACDPKSWSDLETRQTIGWILVGAGSAAVVGSAIWYYLRSRSDDGGGRAWLAPTVGGLVVGGRF